MLSDPELHTVEKGFSVYDHEWRPYARVLGEPHLVDEHLIYFDGTVVCLCAYALGGGEAELSAAEVASLIERVPGCATATAVATWGRFAHADALNVAGLSPVRLPLVAFRDYVADDVDLVIDLETFSYDDEPIARRKKRRVDYSDLAVAVVERARLTAEHIALMEWWTRTHDVSPYHVALAAAVDSYVGDGPVRLVEARLDGDLLGFIVLSLCSATRAVVLQHFARRVTGQPIGDALYASCIEHAIERGIRHLHLGYSETPGLVRFKRGWGAHASRPPYRDAFFTADDELASHIRNGFFPWRERMLARAGHARWEQR